MASETVQGALSGTRRKALMLPAAAFGGMLTGTWCGAFAGTALDPADWPPWAPSRRKLHDRIAELRSRAVSVRRFGARLDGRNDDTAALAEAYASGASAVLVDGPMRLTESLRIARSFAIMGGGPGPHLIWDGEGASPLFLRSADEDDPDAYVRDVVLSGIAAHRTIAERGGPVLVHAVNVRGLTITGCTTRNMGLAFVTHQRLTSGRYDRTRGSFDVDPAVLAGFSPDTPDDLNEDICCIDNDVDNGVYQSALLRFNFARRVLVAGNIGRFAMVSWWGGGAKRNQGGNPQFLRRARDVYVADNKISGVNGCVYGNNGQNVIVARNNCSDALDTAIDFEGCMDCHAYDNNVRNAGNFGISTFFAARNIVFERNYVEQDGSAVQLPDRFGARIGAARGISLVALRSAGFARSKDITIRFSDNVLVYSGPEQVGTCLPSYFDTVVFTGNRLYNVACDWRYAFSRKLVIRNNRLDFDRPAPKPLALLAGRAQEAEIGGNEINVGAAMPSGSVAIGFEPVPKGGKVVVTGNRLSGSGARDLPIVFARWRDTRPSAQVVIQGNSGMELLTDPSLGNGVGFEFPDGMRARSVATSIPDYPAPLHKKALPTGGADK